MKVAVLNFSGNVGKTTVASQLLKPRMGDVPFFAIESINIGADARTMDVEKLQGRQFGELIDALMTLDSAIIDVGASNVETFFKLMAKYDGSHKEFDFFVVPVISQTKAQGDTVNTILALQKIGVDKNRIRLLFNNVEEEELLQSDFPAMFGFSKQGERFVLNAKAFIQSNEVFEKLKSVGKSLAEISADPVDYRYKLRHATDPSDKEFCVTMVALKRLAVTANKNLDNAYRALFEEVAN